MKANFQPYVVVYDSESKTTTIGDRLFRPICRLAGRFPRCAFDTAVACDPDEPRLYGAAGTTFLYGDDNAPRCDPAVRRRLADLLAKCPMLREEVARRIRAAEGARPAPQSHADLVAATWP